MANQERKRPNLLPELITEILVRLPVKYLVRFKCVSKTWYDQINSLDFIKFHLRRSLEAPNSSGSLIFYLNSSLYHMNFHEYPNHRATKLPISNELDRANPIELVGSCNGLLCFQVKNNRHFGLYNPASQAYKQLPKVGGEIKNSTCHCISDEFAYDCVRDDYIVIRNVSYYTNNLDKISEETQLYSLKANSWKFIENPPQRVRSRTIATNNCLHWMSSDKENPVIWCFDLCSSTHDQCGYHQMPIPIEIDHYHARLAVLGGYLHIITNSLDIWVMKEYGVHESWTRLFHLDEKIKFPPKYDWMWWLTYACSKDGTKILVGVEGEPKNFICCDLDLQLTSKIEVPGLPIEEPVVSAGWFVAEPWVESLVL